MMTFKHCAWCGKEFVSYDNPKARFCSRTCSGHNAEYERRVKAFESKSLEQLAVEANENRMSYGEWTAQCLADLQAYKRRNGGK